MLTDNQMERYGRNLRLRNISEEGQERLLNSSALLVGVGGLGSPISLYLAAAGIGRITIVESDKVELSNLQRQVVLDTPSVGMRKAEVAKKRLKKLNPDTEVRTVDSRFDDDNARKLVAESDIVLDASDNFRTKLLVNDASIAERKPCSIGSVLEYHGQVSSFVPGKGPCYRCLFRQPKDGMVPTTTEVGVLGSVSGIIGLIQATEAVKILLDIGRPLIGRLLLLDGLEMEFQEIKFQRNPGCPSCGEDAGIEMPI